MNLAFFWWASSAKTPKIQPTFLPLQAWRAINSRHPKCIHPDCYNIPSWHVGLLQLVWECCHWSLRSGLLPDLSLETPLAKSKRLFTVSAKSLNPIDDIPFFDVFCTQPSSHDTLERRIDRMYASFYTINVIGWSSRRQCRHDSQWGGTLRGWLSLRHLWWGWGSHWSMSKSSPHRRETRRGCVLCSCWVRVIR